MGWNSWNKFACEIDDPQPDPDGSECDAGASCDVMGDAGPGMSEAGTPMELPEASIDDCDAGDCAEASVSSDAG